MTGPSLPTIVRAGRLIVSVCLYAFPARFRRQYGADALTYYVDRVVEAHGRTGVLGVLSLTARDAVSAVAAGLAERGGRGSPSGGPFCYRADVAHGFRSLRRHPGFVLAAAGPVALGVAGVTAVFAVIDIVLLRPLPYPDPDVLVEVGRPLDNGVLAPISTANLIDLEEAIGAFTEVGGVQGGSTLVYDDEGATLEQITRPTRAFMNIVGLDPARGRGFNASEFREPTVAIVTHDLWQRRWGGVTNVLGATLRTDLGDLTVVGVLPRDWIPPEALRGSAGDLWVPLDYSDPIVQRTRAFGFSSGVARLADPSDLGAANEQLRASALALAEAHPSANTENDGTPRMLEARPLHAQTVGQIGDRLGLIFAGVATLLLIACANVANMFLARGADRRREISLRTVLGAGRARLVVQLLTESVVIALIGGTVGCVLAFLSVDTLAAFTPDLPRAGEVAVDMRVTALAAATSVLAGLAFGMVPAWSTSQVDPGRDLTLTALDGTSGQTARAVLVVGQIALTVVLVAGGALLLNSVVRLAMVEVGFETDEIYVVTTRQSPLTDKPASTNYVRTMGDQLAAIPGVSHVSGSMFLPGEGLPVQLEIEHPASGEPLKRWRHSVLPGFFSTVGIPLIAGRDFDPSEGPDDVREIVVSESLADDLWPGESPVGRTLSSSVGQGNLEWVVIGVVADIRNGGPKAEIQGLAYHSWYQDPWMPSMAFLFRYSGDAAALTPALREAAVRADVNVPLTDVSALADRVGENTVEERHYALLLSLFSLIALGIAAVGVYATVTFTVSTRLEEVGIRRAVGAGGADVVALVVRRGLLQAIVGVGLGVVIALLASKILAGLLFEVAPTDPLSFAVVATILVAVAVAASLVPAMRAARVDPLMVLRPR